MITYKHVGSILIVCVLVLVISGCSKAEKEPVKQPEKKSGLNKVDDDRENGHSFKKKNEVNAGIMKGAWVGTLDNRKATLTVTEEKDGSFKGKITVNYRTPLNQEIEGNFDPETMSVTMEDMLRSRYKGTYNGKLSEEGNVFSGVFTTLVDKKNFDFNLTKQKNEE